MRTALVPSRYADNPRVWCVGGCWEQFGGSAVAFIDQWIELRLRRKCTTHSGKCNVVVRGKPRHAPRWTRLVLGCKCFGLEALIARTKLQAKTHFHFWLKAQRKTTKCSDWADWGLCWPTTEGQVCHFYIQQCLEILLTKPALCLSSCGSCRRVYFCVADDESKTTTMKLTSPLSWTTKPICRGTMKRSSQRRTRLDEEQEQHTILKGHWNGAVLQPDDDTTRLSKEHIEQKKKSQSTSSAIWYNIRVNIASLYCTINAYYIKKWLHLDRVHWFLTLLK